MQQVRLTRHEAETDLLPPICMCCGADAALRRTQRLTWKPGWVSILLLLPFAVLYYVMYLGDPFAGLPFITLLYIALVAAMCLAPYFVLNRLARHRLLLVAPLCPQHWYHWQWRSVGIPLSFLALLTTCVSGSLLFVPAGMSRPAAFCNPWMSLMNLMGWAWLVIVLKLHFSMIRPTEIDERFVTLVSVHQRFADAVNRQHRLDVPPALPEGNRGSEQFFDPRA